MKIRILSDLHIEHNMPEEVPACGADLTILAGDIANGRDGIDWAARVYDGPVLYVPGNHEYYESTFDAVSRQMTDAAGESGNVTLLSEGIAEFEDADGQRVRVIGTTWWTDYCLYGVDRVDDAMQAC